MITSLSYRTKKNRKKVITPDDINSLFSEKKAADDEENEEEEEEEEDNQLAGEFNGRRYDCRTFNEQVICIMTSVCH